MTSSAGSFGTETYSVLPGSASVGLNVMRLTVRSAFMAPSVFSLWLGRRFACTAIARGVYIFVFMFFKIFKFLNTYKYICIHTTMATPGEFDPTYPEGDRDGAGAAEGGDMGGDSAGDSTLPPPLQPPEEIDRTNIFNPPETSTPHRPEDTGETIELNNMPLDEMELDPDDIPSLEGFINADEKKTVLDKARRFIKDKFPKVDYQKLGPIGFSKKPGNEDTIVRFGPKGGEESVFKKDGSSFLKSFTDRFKTSLGPSAEALLAEENQEIRELNQRKKEAENN